MGRLTRNNLFFFLFQKRKRKGMSGFTSRVSGRIKKETGTMAARIPN
jgi:hypothetical protein